MAEARDRDRPPAPHCCWRTPAETLELVEALERIEAMLVRLDAYVRDSRVAAGGGEDARR